MAEEEKIEVSKGEAGGGEDELKKKVKQKAKKSGAAIGFKARFKPRVDPITGDENVGIDPDLDNQRQYRSALNEARTKSRQGRDGSKELPPSGDPALAQELAEREQAQDYPPDLRDARAQQEYQQRQRQEIASASQGRDGIDEGLAENLISAGSANETGPRAQTDQLKDEIGEAGERGDGKTTEKTSGRSPAPGRIEKQVSERLKRLRERRREIYRRGLRAAGPAQGARIKRLKRIKNFVRIIKVGAMAGLSLGDIFLSLPLLFLSLHLDWLAHKIWPLYPFDALDKGMLILGWLMIIIAVVVIVTILVVVQNLFVS